VTRFRGSVRLTTAWQHFDFKVEGPVATVTLNRPEKLNPLTFESYADLRDLLAELPHHEGVKVLVIQGEGRGFCGGGDVNEIIGELIKMKAGELMQFTKMTGDVIRAMRECPIPIIVKIQGIAAGAGAVVALAADFRVVSRSGRFAFLFTKVGLSGADMGAAWLLPRIVGFGRATELLMTGDFIDAHEAFRIGLCNRVVADGEALTAATAFAEQLARGPLRALEITKHALNREAHLDMLSALDEEARIQASLMTEPDFREAHAAFAAKRPPKFR
jgi:enoyl-CoA hydratase/carnithine racemase